jgi:glycosyltransferase involved in cell wall biosynthesis
MYKQLAKYKQCMLYEYMPQNDFAKLLAKSHLLLFPSIYEGCPHLVIEALSSGLPVVCFNVPGPREIIEGSLCGAVIKPFELHNMASDCGIQVGKGWT